VFSRLFGGACRAFLVRIGLFYIYRALLWRMQGSFERI